MKLIKNAIFAAEDGVFGAACKLAGLARTARQASKFRMGKGH